MLSPLFGLVWFDLIWFGLVCFCLASRFRSSSIIQKDKNKKEFLRHQQPAIKSRTQLISLEMSQAD